MISIIVVGRNDNYGGEFEARLFATVGYNLEECAKRGIDCELVFVEWNPLADRPLLSHKVTETFDQARCFVVDEVIHRSVSQNRHIALFEFHAKNAGARRARGEWLLLTNADDYLGREVLDFLQQGNFDPDTLYRAGFIDIEGAGEIDHPELIDAHFDDPPPFCYASGDFMFCSRSLFDRVGGYREDLAFTGLHMDSVFCHAVTDMTGRVRKVGKTYHLRHGRDEMSRRRLNYDWLKVDRSPQADYGLAKDCVTEEIAPRVTGLNPSAALLQAVAGKEPPEPQVPPNYRPPGWLLRRIRRPWWIGRRLYWRFRLHFALLPSVP